MRFSVDCVVIGGGMAGLFLLARLRQAGYSALLLEKAALGQGQTIASQGMIHGGMKYALQGFLSPSARAISKMPETWRGYFQAHPSTTSLHFDKTCLLADGQCLFSSGQITSKITQFFGAKALASHVKSVSQTDYPPVLQNSAYRGSVYQLQEFVLDIPKILAAFQSQYRDALIKVAPQAFLLEKDRNHKLTSLTATLDNGERITLQANHYFFTAGEGNVAFLDEVPGAKMQTRPLRMVMVKAPTLSTLFGHAMVGGVNPEVTISSHRDRDNQLVWYIGGQLAESGIHLDEVAQAHAAKSLLAKLFPWLDLSAAQVASFMINRAEYADAKGARPESFSIAAHENITVAWPTKLALSPLLADTLLDELKITKQFEMPAHTLPVPDVAVAPWQRTDLLWS